MPKTTATTPSTYEEKINQIYPRFSESLKESDHRQQAEAEPSRWQRRMKDMAEMHDRRQQKSIDKKWEEMAKGLEEVRLG